VLVAALPSVASSFMPEAIAGFQSAFPGIAIVLRDALGARINDVVNSGEVDFGISGPPPAEAHLQFSPMGSDKMVAVSLAPIASARGKRISIDDLAKQSLILMSRDSTVRRIVEEAFAASGTLATPVQEPAFMSTAIAMVRAGLGVAILPSSAAEVRAAKDLVTHRITSRLMGRHIGIICRRGTLSPAAEEFRRYLRATAKKWF
jgi:DNA-binding transcriptional LysR family regulator